METDNSTYIRLWSLQTETLHTHFNFSEGLFVKEINHFPAKTRPGEMKTDGSTRKAKCVVKRRGCVISQVKLMKVKRESGGERSSPRGAPPNYHAKCQTSQEEISIEKFVTKICFVCFGNSRKRRVFPLLRPL